MRWSAQPMLESRRRAIIRQKYLCRIVWTALAGPHDALAVRGENRQAVKPRKIGQPRAISSLCRQKVEIVLRRHGFVVALVKYQIPTRWMPIGTPVQLAIVRQLLFVRPLEIVGENLQISIAITVAAVQHSVAVGREKGAAVVAFGMSDASRVLSVGI